MQTDRILNIAYGSNLNLGQMRERCPGATIFGAGMVSGYRLLFRGEKDDAFLTIEPAPDRMVPVLLWVLSEEDERSLDRYEGYPEAYRKETITVMMADGPIDAMVYIMNGPDPFNRPSARYLQTVREGYATAGFDPVFIERALAESPPVG